MPIKMQICMGSLQPILSHSQPKKSEPPAEPIWPRESTTFIESANGKGGGSPPTGPPKA